MTKAKLKRLFILFIVIYTILVVSFYFLAQHQLKYKKSAGNIVMLETESVTEGISDGLVISQSFKNNIDRIEKISIMFTKFYKNTNGKIVIELADESNILMRKKVDIQDIKDQRVLDIVLENPVVDARDKVVTLSVYAENNEDSGVAIMMNRESSLPTDRIKMGNRIIRGSLCFSVTGVDESYADDYYWYIMSILGILMALLLFVSYRKYCNGRVNYIVAGIFAIYNYKFLISQLVIRVQVLL